MKAAFSTVLAIMLLTDLAHAQPEATQRGIDTGLEEARQLIGKGEYALARQHFRRIGADKNAPGAVAEEARYLEAECLRLQGYLPAATVAYQRLIGEFPAGKFRQQANQRLFSIANHWLDDTRLEMEQMQQSEATWLRGKLLGLSAYFHYDKTKPFFNEETWAIQTLDQVVRNDPKGPEAAKALFFMASVQFFRKAYPAAEGRFAELLEKHADSPLAPKAISIAIICKILNATEGEIDGKKLRDAQKLVTILRRDYPQEAAAEEESLNRRLQTINHMQAEGLFTKAERHRRRGELDQARALYEEVCRRHAGTPPAERARQRLDMLQEQRGR